MKMVSRIMAISVNAIENTFRSILQITLFLLHVSGISDPLDTIIMILFQ